MKEIKVRMAGKWRDGSIDLIDEEGNEYWINKHPILNNPDYNKVRYGHPNMRPLGELVKNTYFIVEEDV